MALTEAQRAMLRFMRKCKKLRASMDVPPEFHYCGMEHFLLEHGKWWPVEPWTDEYDEGAPKQCFGNALLLGATKGLRYVEGVATPPPLVGLPIYHGWNVDAEGRVIDATWLNSGLCYFGVEFSVGRCDDAMWNGDASILDDYKRKHPLFRQRWHGEDFSKVWEPSEGMIQMWELLGPRTKSRR